MTIKEILTEEDVVEYIRDNMDTILSIIPEIQPMINFPQNHPHHHLDVWEHTLLALSFSNNNYETRLALLLHDIGKPHSYQDEEVRHFHGHADVSEQRARQILPRLDLTEEQINKICYLIKYHDLPITDEEIKENPDLMLERLHIQECDSKAHHPNHQAKRLKYIAETKNKLPYQYEKYHTQNIMEESRHHFIYAYDSERRTRYIEKLEDQYPFQMDTTSPSGIYLPTSGLPKIEYPKSINKTILKTIASEYLSLLIIQRILQKSSQQLDITKLNDRLQEIIKMINKNDLSKDYQKLHDIDDFKKVIALSLRFYENYHRMYLSSETPTSIEENPLPFISLEQIITLYKEALNNPSYINILINGGQPIDLYSTKSINLLVGSRINSDISMNIFTEPDKWPIYTTTNDQIIEAVHDYGTIELDESSKEYSKLLRSRFYGNR